MGFSGIITTNLGKTATLAKVAGRERRVHHSKSLPLLVTGERFFFGPLKGRPGPPDLPIKITEKQTDTSTSNEAENTRGAFAPGLRVVFGIHSIGLAGAGWAIQEQR